MRHTLRHPNGSVEALNERIGALRVERQELRAHGAGPELLERNRMAIVSAQWELSYALIERYYPAARTAA